MNTDKELFARFVEDRDDYLATCQDIHATMDLAREVREVIEDRIRTDQARDAALMEELRAKSQDTTRTETVRAMTAQQLAKLEGATYAATPEELSTYRRCLETWAKMERDCAQMRTNFETAANAVREAEKRIRADVLGGSTPWGNWLAGEQQRFNQLLQRSEATK